MDFTRLGGTVTLPTPVAQHHTHNSRPPNGPAKTGRLGSLSKSRLLGVVSAVFAVAVVVLVVKLSKKAAPPDQPAGPPLTNRAQTNAATGVPTETKLPSQKLVGKWLRPDGEYVLDIASVSGNGEMRAAYYNPRAIRVARAEAYTEGPTNKIYVELRDEGYPGSYYSLAFVPEKDQLVGMYFQATLRETYDVLFVRLPEPGR